MPARPALTADGIVGAAARVADAGGLGKVSMRNVGKELGVEAMSLYHHLAGKDALVDGLADWAFARIEAPAPDEPWRPAMARRAASARAVLRDHPWALGLLESRRSPGPSLLRHHDAVLGCLRGNGFPVRLAAHAFSLLDAYIYGFVLTESNLPFEAGEGVENFVAQMTPALAGYPHLSEMVTTMVLGRDYDYADEFAVGLEMILDILEARLRAAAGQPAV